ncbi:chromosome partitioning protein [Reichenbachiella faecimaris]|uniref:Chromosome partitioning protein n=1 Tax=Reichenbachiella faecimaris TaxID=692418 RepID=A0A1W2G6C9_REIFA|nr:ParA family protein [Reichenbachiella faecimaris]SMD31856.1 chromosome partitioning protein [Reichenbachiella faecimaris]
MSRTIAIYNFKGGVGKTTTTLNLALSWSRSFKVLVIDCDPQANLTHTLTGHINHKSNLYTILKDIIHNRLGKVEPVELSGYLHIIPGDYKMTNLEENSEFISFGNGLFYKLLSPLKQNYDLILLDCPTHFGTVVKSSIANVKSILIPALADSFSTLGFRKLLTYLSEVERDARLNVLGIFFNLYRKNTRHHRMIKDEAAKELGELLLNQTIRQGIKVSEANWSHRSIYSFEEKNEVGDDFMKLSEEVLGRLDAVHLDQLMYKVV